MNETLKRLISGTIYVFLLIACILHSTESFFILFGIFLVIAVVEFCDLVQINKTISLLIAVTSYFLFYSTRSKPALVLTLSALALTILVAIKCILFLFNNKSSLINSFSKYTYLIGYIILPFVFITKIGYNPKIIIGIFILIWTNDTFAYIIGKSIGKRKLFERVSPNKTIEGFIGGVIFAIIASYIIAKYYIEIKEANTYIWIIIAIIISVFGTIGDLVESKFKRIAGVKDSGIIMPGHGGILDRLDSVIFVAPIVFLFYQILNYL